MADSAVQVGPGPWSPSLVEGVSISLWENRQELPDLHGGFKFEEYAFSNLYIATKKCALVDSACFLDAH